MDIVSKSYFAVLNNPAEHGYDGTPEEACQHLMAEWISDRDNRTGAWAYCVSADGLHHIHMVLESTQAMRFATIKKTYAAGTHFEVTKGNKNQAENYINKVGEYAEKGEEVLYLCQHGEIQGAQGRRSDLKEIDTMIKAGMTPQAIMDTNIEYRRFERIIKSAYNRKRKKETPPYRKVSVHYIVGESGTGKSHTFVDLCRTHDDDNIYFLSDYETGGLDLYDGESILFLDEFKGQYSFGQLLTILEGYRTQMHARYANVLPFWTEVYLTSVFAPEELYKRMVPEGSRSIDSKQQLLRRLTDITYCWRDGDAYCRHTIPATEYSCLAELRHTATYSFRSLPDFFDL